MRAVLGMNPHDQQLLFSDITGQQIFSTTMSANRFKFFHGNICFDDMSTRKDRWPYDKFAASRVAATLSVVKKR